MKNLILVLLFLPVLAAAQPPAGMRVALSMLEKSGVVEGSRAGQIPLTNSDGNLRYAQYVEIESVQLSYIPSSTGNTQHLSEFVKGSDGNNYYIDFQGRSVLLSSQNLQIYGPFPDQASAGAGGVQPGQLFYTGYGSTVYPQGLIVRKN